MMGGQREELPTQIWQNNNEQCCRKWGTWAVFGQTVKPISTRGADYPYHSTTSPPGFSDLATGLEPSLRNLQIKKEGIANCIYFSSSL